MTLQPSPQGSRPHQLRSSRGQARSGRRDPSRLMKNASWDYREQAGVGIEVPLGADSEQPVP